jgi:hypothetical protein
MPYDVAIYLYERPSACHMPDRSVRSMTMTTAVATAAIAAALLQLLQLQGDTVYIELTDFDLLTRSIRTSAAHPFFLHCYARYIVLHVEQSVTAEMSGACLCGDRISVLCVPSMHAAGRYATTQTALAC